MTITFRYSAVLLNPTTDDPILGVNPENKPEMKVNIHL
jgi:hypothetical protein